MNEPSAISLNYNQLNILEPLTKWRILDLNSIEEEISYLYSRSSLHKTVRRLENFGLIHSFKDPFANKKFIYLSKLGESLINPHGISSGIAIETIFHDAKVSEITREMVKRDRFHGATIEHHLPKNEDSHRPDALMTGQFKNTFRMAFELELTQKSKSRVAKRFEYYLKSQAYEYVFYLFPRNRVLSTYHTLLEENFPFEAQKKIILCHNETIFGRFFDLSKGRVFFKGREGEFNDFF